MKHRVLVLAPLPADARLPRLESAIQLDNDRAVCTLNIVNEEENPWWEKSIIGTFNVQHNEWRVFSPKLDEAIKNHRTTGFLSYGTSTDRIYVSGGRDIIAYKQSTNRVTKWKELPKPEVVDVDYWSPQKVILAAYDTWERPWTMLTFNGDIHFLSRFHDVHLVWNGKQGIHKKVRQYPMGIHEGVKWHCSEAWSTGGRAVYIPSKNIILQIGGFANYMVSGDHDLIGEVVKGEIGSDGQWHWEKLESWGDGMGALNAVVTADNKYVIICHAPEIENDEFFEGGYVGSELRELLQHVYVIDIEDDFKWRRTEIEVPIKKPLEEADDDWSTRHDWKKQIMFRTGNGYQIDLIVNGFVRRQYRKFRNMASMPVSLIGLIQSYYPEELIHWVNESQHFAIPLRDVLRAPSVDVMSFWRKRWGRG